MLFTSLVVLAAGTVASAVPTTTDAAAASTTSSTAVWHADAWLGCLQPSSSITAERTVSLTDMTPQVCMDHCFDNNYNFAVLTAGNTCACAQDFDDSDSVSSLLCTTTCSGDLLSSCGGLLGTYDVYLTAVIGID